MELRARTYGTEGDTRPLVMLCHGLRPAGLEMMLLAEQGTLGSARELGVSHAALEGDIHDEVVALVARGNNLAAASRGLARMARRHVPAWMAQADAVAAGCDAVLTGGLAALVGLSVAEGHGLPAIGTGMIPLTPTRAFASPFLPPMSLPGVLRRASYGLVNQAVWRTFRRSINAARAGLGQRPRRALWAGLPMLYCISPQLLPPPADWPADQLVCGQWRMPEQPCSPSAVLEASASVSGLRQHDRLRPRACAAASGLGRAPAGALPANVFVLGPTPHEALFPRCTLAIHHGGSGTAHSTCRAGIPSLVMPFAADQFFWARGLQTLGVAPAPLSPRRLHAATLAAAIAFAEGSTTRARAAALGTEMASEDGAATGVAIIECWLQPQ